MTVTKETILSLLDLLNTLNKEELHGIRRTLNIGQASQLNKSDLIRRLQSYMIERLGEHLERFDLKRYNVLTQIMKAPGCKMPIAELLGEDYDQEPSYYQSYGLLFFQDADVIMPYEIREALLSLDAKHLKPIVERNTEWIRLTQGLLYFYGVMELGELKQKVEHYTGTFIDTSEFQQVISELERYDWSVLNSPSGYMHYTVDDAAAIVEERSSRPELDYYPFIKEQLLRAAEDEYVERHEGYEGFVSFLRKNWAMDAEEADVMTADIVDRIRLGLSPSDLVADLQEELEFRDMKHLEQLVAVVVPLMNKTRLWELKGYSPDELSGKQQKGGEVPKPQPSATGTSGQVYSFQSKKKVGRNDPCPCGSGKKFKKCCLG